MAMVGESIIDNKLSALITTLIYKTSEGKVSWAPTINDGEFLAGFSRYVISVKENSIYRKEGKEPYIEIALLDPNGKIMEVATSYAGDSTTFGPGIFHDYEELRELFVLARRSAHNVAESLDNLLHELESR